MCETFLTQWCQLQVMLGERGHIGFPIRLRMQEQVTPEYLTDTTPGVESSGGVGPGRGSLYVYCFPYGWCH